MPQRHGKNAGDRHHFTYREKEEAGHGTQKVRLGGDSQLQFGHCALCLQDSKDPMASPSGNIYCRECILEYILNKTKELKRIRAAYDAQQARRTDQEAVAQEEQLLLDAGKFIASQVVTSGKGSAGKMVAPAPIKPPPVETTDVILFQTTTKADATPITSITENRKRQAEESAAREEYFRAKAAKTVDDTTLDQHRETLKRTSFWLPSHAPDHLETEIPPPETRPRSPMTDTPLRAKDLMAVQFTVDEQNKKTGAPGRILCAVTRKEINTQPAVLISKSGQVILQSAAEEFVYPTMVCPVTSVKLKKSDIIPLVKAASGFASSGAVQAKVYQPTLS